MNSHQVLAHVRHVAYCFVPQFFRTRYFDDPLPRVKKIPTSWINGLRGWAALTVVLFHNVLEFEDVRVYPQEPNRWPSWWWAPVVHLPFSGHSMVALFFVIGGYVLSLKPLQMMNSTEVDLRSKIMSTMSHSVFRRWFRLYLPAFAISAIDMLFRHGHFWVWLHQMRVLCSIFFHGSFIPYLPVDPNLWTIPLEMRSSIILFVALMGVAHLNPYMRLAALVWIGAYSFGYSRWEVALFIFGAASVQLELVTGRLFRGSSTSVGPLGEDEEEPAELTRSWWHTTSTGATSILILIAIWLMSSTEHRFEITPGFVTISSHIPSWFVEERSRFWPSIGAVFLLNGLRHSEPNSYARRAFDADLSQYLGTISFALYLVHGPQLRIYGFFTPHWLWRVLPKNNVVGYVTGLSLGLAFNFCVYLCVADIFAREVETKLVRITLRFDNLCSAHNDK